MIRCICFHGSREQPPETDPACPRHGYDEDSWTVYGPDEDTGYDPDEDDPPFDDARDGPLIDARFWNYPY